MRILSKHSKCSCSETSNHWSWPFTRAHEKYHDHVVTTVTCLKHAWSVRLYDGSNLRFFTISEEEQTLRQMESSIPPSHRSGTDESKNVWMKLAYTAQ